MHARHRSPGNGYRSNSMGVGGVAATSRISPEGSARGHVMYSSGYRNYNRGFGRGLPKPFQPPQPPPPRRGDIFMEAGRLATEYLVSKGLLPPNVFSGRWQNDSLKNHVGDFQGFRPQEGENLHFPPEGRPSALARLGDAVPDAGSGRKRFPDEYNLPGSRNFTRERRRMGSSYGSMWNRETGRSASWSEKARFSPDKMGNDDSFSGYHEELQIGKDGSSGEQKSRPSELAPKSEAAGDLDTALEKYRLPNDVGSKASSSSTGKDLSSEVDVELTEMSDGMKILNGGTEGEKDDSNNDEMEKQSATEDIPILDCAVEDDHASKDIGDLLRHCRFAKVPTKTRSSLTIRGSKTDPVLITEDENTQESGLTMESGAFIENVSVDGSSVDASSNQGHSLTWPESDNLKVPTDDAGELGMTDADGQGKCMRSRSFPERAFMNEPASSEGPPGFGRCSSMILGRGEKRAVQHSDSREGTKKPREWALSMDTHVDDYLQLSNSNEKQQTSEEGRTSPGEKVFRDAEQKMSVDISLFPKGDAEPCIEYAEEKQLFPASFKICDLNLMEASDANENHNNADPILILPSIPKSENEAAEVDIDLSMSSNCNISDKYGRRGADGKEVEVIDLDNETMHEDKTFNNSEQKDETVFTGLESFPNHVQNVNNIPDVQDGYGLMLSELLGNDIPNCSSVPSDVNSLHNEMGIHNAEGILGDDDAIYMSLGEIPISFLRVWEQQPTQEFEKPF